MSIEAVSYTHLDYSKRYWWFIRHLLTSIYSSILCAVPDCHGLDSHYFLYSLSEQIYDCCSGRLPFLRIFNWSSCAIIPQIFMAAAFHHELWLWDTSKQWRNLENCSNRLGLRNILHRSKSLYFPQKRFIVKKELVLNWLLLIFSFHISLEIL